MLKVHFSVKRTPHLQPLATALLTNWHVVKQMNLLPRQLAQDLLEDDYRSLQNVLMTRSGRY